MQGAFRGHCLAAVEKRGQDEAGDSLPPMLFAKAARQRPGENGPGGRGTLSPAAWLEPPARSLQGTLTGEKEERRGEEGQGDGRGLQGRSTSRHAGSPRCREQPQADRAALSSTVGPVPPLGSCPVEGYKLNVWRRLSKNSGCAPPCRLPFPLWRGPGSVSPCRRSSLKTRIGRGSPQLLQPHSPFPPAGRGRYPEGLAGTTHPENSVRCSPHAAPYLYLLLCRKAVSLVKPCTAASGPGNKTVSPVMPCPVMPVPCNVCLVTPGGHALPGLSPLLKAWIKSAAAVPHKM